jgi:hypothetical protein
VDARRLDAYEELVGDLAVGAPRGDKGEDLLFAVGETEWGVLLVDRTAGQPDAGAGGEPFDQTEERLGAQSVSCLVDVAYRGDGGGTVVVGGDEASARRKRA